MLKKLDNNEDRIKIERLYSEYRDKLYGVAYNILNDQMYAEDAVHDTIVRITKHLHKIDENNRSKTTMFLVIICRNIAIDIYNKNKRMWKREISIDEIEVYEDKSEHNPLNIYICNESIRILIDGIKQLKSIYSDVMLLKYVSECDNGEISKLLAISQATVRKRLERGREMLKEKLEKELSAWE